MEQAARELLVMTGRAHHSRDRHTARTELQWCFDHHAVFVRFTDVSVDTFDG